MKFYLSMATAAILMTGTVKAQHVNIGVKAGLNLYTINSNSPTNFEAKAGVHIGLLGHIHLTKQIAFQPELVYSTEGAKYTSDGMEAKIKLGYINVPLLLQYMFENGFRLEGGPQVGFLINAKTETDAASTNIKENLNKVDFALGAGIGYVSPKSGFGVDARYNLGLSNTNDQGPVKSTNRGFQVGAVYQFKH